MCRSNVIIYQNETKFEIYCNDKTESHHITNIFFESGDKHHNLGMNKVTHYTYCDFPGYSKCGKNILLLFPVTFFPTCLVTFYPVTFFPFTIYVLYI